MYRITDPEKSRAFSEALGFESRRELPIIREGELEATNSDREPNRVREGGSRLFFVRDPIVSSEG